MRLEATTISEILYLSGQGNFIFIREKAGKRQGKGREFQDPVTVATMLMQYGNLLKPIFFLLNYSYLGLGLMAARTSILELGHALKEGK